MLPPNPPKMVNKDYDPSTYPNDKDAEIHVDKLESQVQLSSVEINILIYLYLVESGLAHTAFSLLSETDLPQTSLFQHYNPSYPTPSSSNKGKASQNPNGYGRPQSGIERGQLVRRLWQGLRWEEVERHVAANGVSC
jgi:transducin (beta)-like 1